MQTHRISDERARPAADRGGSGLLERKWLMERTQEELVQLITEITLELSRRLAADTTQAPHPSGPVSFPAVEEEAVNFLRLPVASSKTPEQAASTLWRIILTSSNPGHAPLGLEVYDDVTIGRLAEGNVVDLDLHPYDAEELGVSRQHALLRPTEDSLQLFDLGSANGTLCNMNRVRLGLPLAVKDGDVIALGALQFKVQIVSWPGMHSQ